MRLTRKCFFVCCAFLARQALDLVKADHPQKKKLTALLKSYNAKAGVDVKADVKRAEAEKAARPFRELSHTEQDRRCVAVRASGA